MFNVHFFNVDVSCLYVRYHYQVRFNNYIVCCAISTRFDRLLTSQKYLDFYWTFFFVLGTLGTIHVLLKKDLFLRHDSRVLVISRIRIEKWLRFSQYYLPEDAFTRIILYSKFSLLKNIFKLIDWEFELIGLSGFCFLYITYW